MKTETAAEAIYLSPHLDDAVLSCGGQIADRARKGRRTAIVTVFTRDEAEEGLSDFAAGLHRLFGLDREVVATRRAEDEIACARLGTRAEHWNELEGIYRRRGDNGEPLYPDRERLFPESGEVDAADRRLQERIRRRLAALPESRELFCPLAVGGHVDHWVVRLAAEAARGRNLSYYEDYPYAQDDPRALGRAQRGHEWWSEVIPVSAEGIQARIEATAAYASQLRALFSRPWHLRVLLGSRKLMERRIRQFIRSRGGEKIWRRFPEAPRPPV